MTRSHHPRPTRKRNVRRHAGDVEHHLDNAIRSLNAIRGMSRVPGVQDLAERLRSDLLAAKRGAAVLTNQAGREAAGERELAHGRTGEGEASAQTTSRADSQGRGLTGSSRAGAERPFPKTLAGTSPSPDRSASVARTCRNDPEEGTHA